jgi:hypothetical protein
LAIGGNRFSKNTDSFEHVCDIAPDEWLYLIHHAKYIVTNSFHGTAFSINYRKEFYLELSSKSNSRLEQITKMLGLESRIVSGGRVGEIVPTDYSVTNEKLPKLVAQSVEFLKNALGCKDDTQ